MLLMYRFDICLDCLKFCKMNRLVSKPLVTPKSFARGCMYPQTKSQKEPSECIKLHAGIMIEIAVKNGTNSNKTTQI